MADVQSLYQLEQSASPVVDTAFSPFTSGIRPWSDKYGAELPNALLHRNLNGLVANDSSYITNAFTTEAGSRIAINIYKFDTFPSGGITALKLKFRWQTNDPGSSNPGDVAVAVYQGRPNNVNVDESSGNFYWFEGVIQSSGPAAFSVLAAAYDEDPFSDSAGAANTWFDGEIVIDPALITDSSDLWISIEADTEEESSAIYKFSWVVLEVTYPYSLPETPTFKNYVNDLTRILNLSVRQEGTKGSTKYCYRVVPCDSDGVCGPPSDEVVVTDGNATLDATNHICLSWLDVTDATNYKVYRTCGPSNLGIGLLATVLPDLGDCGTGGGGDDETGYKDDGSDCVTDCDDIFNPDDFEGCEETT